MQHASKNKSVTATELTAALSASALLISEGMHNGWTAPALPKEHPGLSNSNTMWLEAIFFFGEIVTSFFAVYVLDKVGRKNAVLISAVFSFVPWFLLIFSLPIEVLYLARFLAGAVSYMSMNSVSIYVSEIASPKVRNLLLGAIMCMHTFGIFLIYTLVPFSGFSVPSLVAMVVLTALLSVFYFMPESPYYFLLINEENLARDSLKRLRNMNNIDEEISEMKRTLSEHGLAESKIRKFEDLVFTKSNRKALVISIAMCVAYQFSGFEPILMNVTDILTKTQSVDLAPSVSEILFSLALLMGHFLCISFVNSIGKKKLFLCSALASGLCLLFLGVYFHLIILKVDVVPFGWVSTLSIVAYAISLTFGFGSLIETLSAELFSTRVRAMGTTIVQSLNSLFGMLSVLLYNWIVDDFDTFIIFYFYTVVIFSAALFVLCVLKETNGKSLNQIQDILGN